MRVLDLFSGIGGISLGLERAGMKTIAFCEIEKFQRAVLAHHWPGVPIYEDITKLSADALRRDGIHGCDIIAGGFPCQDISVAGKGAGIEKGERSGLWREMYRLICELRPTWVLAENVPALRTRGADRVISDLEAAGYTVEPLVVGAWAVGAPHKRDRVWVIGKLAHAEQDGPIGAERRSRAAGAAGEEPTGTNNAFNSEGAGVLAATKPDVAHRDEDGQHRLQRSERIGEEAGAKNASGDEPDGCGEAVGNASEIKRDEELDQGDRTRSGCEVAIGGSGGDCRSVGLADTCEAGSEERHAAAESNKQGFGAWCRHAWPARPGEQQHDWEESRVKWQVGAATDGISERLVRFANRCTLGAAGNSVVPQVVEVIGRGIMHIDQTLSSALTSDIGGS